MPQSFLLCSVLSIAYRNVLARRLPGVMEGGTLGDMTRSRSRRPSNPFPDLFPPDLPAALAEVFGTPPDLSSLFPDPEELAAELAELFGEFPDLSDLFGGPGTTRPKRARNPRRK